MTGLPKERVVDGRPGVGARVASLFVLASLPVGCAGPPPQEVETTPGIFRVALPVSDIDRAEDFYGRVLGIPGERVWSNRLYFRCGPTVLACVDPRPPGDRGEVSPNPDHVYFAVDSLEEVLARCRDAACKRLDERIETQPWGERSFYAEDPFGNKLCFVDRTTMFVGRGAAPEPRASTDMKQTWPIIAVADVARSSAWYMTLLEAHETHAAATVFNMVVDDQGRPLLCLHHWGPSGPGGDHHWPTLSSPADGKTGNGLLLWFVVEDLEAAWQRARSLDAAIEEPPNTDNGTGMPAFVVRDPDGYHVAVNQARP